MKQSLKRQELQRRIDSAKLKREREEHEKYHVGGTIVLQCRFCRRNYVNYAKMKGKESG